MDIFATLRCQTQAMAPARIGLPDRQSENFEAAIRLRLGAGMSDLFLSQILDNPESETGGH